MTSRHSHRYRWIGSAALGAGLLGALAIAGAKSSRQPSPTSQPAQASQSSSASQADPRLTNLRDVDHPVRFEPHYASKEAWEARARQLRMQIRVAEGLWPEPPRTPLNPVIHGRIERDGYTIEKVFFASMPGHYVCGNLYRPTGRTGKLPGVLCPHGHWANGRMYEAPEKDMKLAIASGGEKTPESARYPGQAVCAALARAGCIAFMYDMVGYADSTVIEHRKGFTDVESVLRLQSFMGLQTWNGLRTVDFMLSLPDVDPNRIAVTGASGGATQTLLLAALDDRIAAAFPAVMVSEAMQGGCICENAPALRVGTNNAELACLFAPKPLGMTAANDWTIDLLTKGFPQIHEIYALYGAADQVAAWHRPFPHNYNQVSRELMYNWFNQWLKLGLKAPVTERPFVPVAPAELSVFDAQHPRPSDFLDAAALRAAMTAESDRQMAELRKDPAAYCNVVRQALRSIVGAVDLRGGGLSVIQLRPPRWIDGAAIQEGVLQSAEVEGQTPFAAAVPGEWNGNVVLWLHPQGQASLWKDGRLIDPAKKLLADGSAIVAPDLLLLGKAAAPANGSAFKPHGKYASYQYSGYYLGYNRSILASRAGDVLRAAALVRSWPQTRNIRLAALGACGPAALAAAAVAGDAIDSSCIDLTGFDFGQAKDEADENLLPGSLKYGGVNGLLPLCQEQHIRLWNASAATTPSAGNLELMSGNATIESLLLR